MAATNKRPLTDILPHEQSKRPPPPENNNLVRNFEINAIAAVQAAASKGTESYTIVIKPMTKEIPKANPKKLKDFITQNIKDNRGIKEIITLRSGDLLIKTSSTRTATQALNLTNILGIPVTANLAMDGILVRYIIRGIDQEIPITEIYDELAEQGIQTTNIRRLTRMNDMGVVQPTRSIIITIIGKYLLPKINLWYQRFNIERFWSRPSQCRNCQRFGHSATKCRSQRRCTRCTEDHSLQDCPCTSIRCANCGEKHQANDKQCTVYITEEKILEYKDRNYCSYREAKAAVSLNEPKKTWTPRQESRSISTTTNRETQLLSQLQEIIGRPTSLEEKVANMIGMLQKLLTTRQEQIQSISPNHETSNEEIGQQPPHTPKKTKATIATEMPPPKAPVGSRPPKTPPVASKTAQGQPKEKLASKERTPTKGHDHRQTNKQKNEYSAMECT